MVKSDIHMLEGSDKDSLLDRDSIMLRPEEKLLSVKRVSTKLAHTPLTALEALQLLAGVTSPQDIGKNGPVIAARVFGENQDVSELRLYEVLFGRDSLIVAKFLFAQYPELTRTTVKRLAELQGVRRNEKSEEEPGKIVHEVRQSDDPLAIQLTALHGWEWPYYGSIDATLLFIRVLVRYVLKVNFNFLKEKYIDRQGEEKNMFEALQSAVAWMLYKMNQNQEGLVESLRLNTEGGTINQGWKDSFDSYHHADGALANKEKGVASIEVQALAYDALLDVAGLYEHMLTEKNSELVDSKFLKNQITELKKRAESLAHIIMSKYWVEDERGGYFVLGSDRDDQGKLRILKVRASNMGHVLDSRLLDGDEQDRKQKKEKLVATLFASDMLNVSGIRTLSSLENRYRPNSYHNGSVWLWDTYQISLGLLRQGYIQQAKDLRDRILHAVQVTKRFPEFVSGAATDTPQIPDRKIRVLDTKYQFEHFIEQPPQEIQAWTVAAVVAIQLSNGE